MTRHILAGISLISCFSIALAQKPQEPVNSGELLLKGIKLHDDKDYEGALEFYEKVPRNDTNYVLALYERAMTLESLEKYEEAIKVAREGLWFKSEYDSQLYMILGNCLDESGKGDEAVQAYNDGIKRFPYNNMLHFNLAIALNKQDKVQEAVDELKIAVRLNPLHAGTHAAIGGICKKHGNYTGAILAYSAMLLLEPFSERANAVVVALNTMCDEKPEVTDSKIVFSSPADNFEDLQAALEGKLFSQSSFTKKVPVKLGYNFVWQNYFVYSEIANNPAKYSEGFFSTFYGPFCGILLKKKWFDEFTYYQMLTVNQEDVQKAIKKNEAAIKKFLELGIQEYIKSVSNHKTKFNGSEQVVHHWYSDGHLEALGEAKGTKTLVLTGHWEYFNSFGSFSGISEFDDNGKQNGLSKTWYETGELLRELNYKDGLADGYIKEYYKSGKLRLHNELKAGTMDGVAKDFFADGTPSSEAIYKMGVREGSYKVYHAIGTIRYELNYSADKLDGKFKEFYANGKLMAEGTFVNGERSGPITYYYPSGKLLSKSVYVNGKTTGPVEEYYENGQLKKKGEMKNDVFVGKYTEWLENGKVESEHEYDENGKGNGIQKEYDEDGILYFESETKKDIIVSYRYLNKLGRVISEAKEEKGKLAWNSNYPTGERYSTGEYVKGKKNGLFRYFDKLGNLLTEERYDDGVIFESKRYFPHGQLKNYSRYKEGELDGPYEAFYYNGKPYIMGWFTKGERNGYWNYYRADGSLSSTNYYILGQQYSFQEEFAPNGKKSSTDFVDAAGDIVRYMYYDSTETLFEDVHFEATTGELVTHHTNGQVKFKGNYKNGLAHGKFSWAYFDGKPETEGQYFSNDKQGTWKWYNTEGKLITMGNYKDDEKDSAWTYYHDNGKVKSIEYFKDGENVGEWITYHDNGQVAQKHTYKYGERSGTSYYYAEDGSLRITKVFDLGLLVGYSYMLPNGQMSPVTKVGNEKINIVAYYKNGKKSDDYNMDKNELNGTYTLYHPNGNVKEKSQYNYGFQEGVAEYYYANGKMKTKENYFANDLHGITTNYDQNGNKTEELSYVMGDLHGVCKYYEKGKLVKTRIYYNDDIVSETKN